MGQNSANTIILSTVHEPQKQNKKDNSNDFRTSRETQKPIAKNEVLVVIDY